MRGKEVFIHSLLISLAALVYFWPEQTHAATTQNSAEGPGFLIKGTLRYRLLFRSPSNPPEARSDYEIACKGNQWKFIVRHHDFGTEPLATLRDEYGFDGTNVHSVQWINLKALSKTAPKQDYRNTATAQILNQPYPKTGWGYPELVWLAYASSDFLQAQTEDRLPYWGIASSRPKSGTQPVVLTANAKWELLANGGGRPKTVTYYVDDTMTTGNSSADQNARIRAIFQMQATTNWHGKELPVSFSFKQFGVENGNSATPITEVIWTLDSLQEFNGMADYRPRMTELTRVQDERVPIGSRGVHAAYIHNPAIERDWRTTGQVAESASYRQQLKTETVAAKAAPRPPASPSSSVLRIMIFALPSAALLFLIIRSANKTKEKA